IESLDEASFPKARKKLFTDISRLFDNSKIMFAKTSAKEFGKDFIAGAKEGNLRLDKLRNKSPKLVEPWLAIPKEKRVFIIAASQNQSEALLLKETLQKKGFECFYYRFCEHIQNELCDSKEVGAFFSTAGHVVTIKSRHSEASSYIPVELAVTDKFINGGVVIIFTPEDLIKSATALNVAIIVINESEKNE
ncbi:MAG: hypothetical protein Q7T85_10535, partial [Nitrosomonas sp.]|nr:hypothetical protein [Nitrosomonas sp.]